MKTKLTLTLSTIILFLYNAYAGDTPTIAVNSSTTKYLSLTNKSASGVINDPTDPLYTIGIDFIITDEDPNSVTITYTSTNPSVVPENSTSNFIVSGTGNIRNIKIKPVGVGYTTIAIKAKDVENKSSSSYSLKYAASAAALNPSDNHFFSHLSSGSTAIAIDDDYMFVGDDEIDEIALYNRKQSGMPVL